MIPFWTSTDGNLTIYHGDALEVLPELDLSTVDLVLTDPPYGINGASGSNRKRGKGEYLRTDWDDTIDYVRTVCAPVVRFCIEEVGRVVVTPGKNNLWVYPQSDDVGCFWTVSSVGKGKWGWTTFNPILYYGRDPRLGKNIMASGMPMGHGHHETLDWHPCPKPLDAWQWLLCKGSLEGETVLDPFAGAFTTLLAAQRAGRKAIGIEIEEYYCERGAERLAQTAFELPPTKPAPVQKELEWVT